MVITIVPIVALDPVIMSIADARYRSMSSTPHGSIHREPSHGSSEAYEFPYEPPAYDSTMQGSQGRYTKLVVESKQPPPEPFVDPKNLFVFLSTAGTAGELSSSFSQCSPPGSVRISSSSARQASE